METYGYAFLFSVTGYMGIQIVLSLVQSCGAFVAVVVTTCRKAVTIILSFIFFSKPFTSQYLFSGVLVLLGIYLNTYSKQSKEAFSLRRIYSSIRKCIRRQNRLQRQILSNV